MTDAARRPPRGLARAIIIAVTLALVASFAALGVWQIERRAWKHRLIAAVEERIHAAPVETPGPDSWRQISSTKDAYRHVRASGHYLPGHDTLVQAVTEHGSGYWVMTPFDTGRFVMIVNRGFVPAEQRNTAGKAAPTGPAEITGLLRISEPGGGFLRDNDPAAGRWYSRDVAAIARAQGIGTVAPYFIDADADAATGRDIWPLGGLTVVRFPDNHMAYALTWFAMAALSGWAGLRVLREKRSATGGDA